MHNFIFEVPVKIIFGKETIEKLAEEVSRYGKRVLLCYGGGSIKKNGVYDKVISQLKTKNIFYKEFAGISPNPRIDEVRAGIKILRENSLDFILAAGGGSVIDCAKAISAGAAYGGDPWDLITRKAEIQNAVPIGSVLTLSATGSEMNCGSVISNLETNEKLGFGHPSLMPKFSILDPSFTCSVPKNQTAAGIADIMSHTLENYFSLNDGAFLQDRFAEAVLKTCIHYGPIAYREPYNLEARENIMWAGTWAINGLLNCGKNTGWSAHAMEHELSAFYDITHGVGLAILTPRWMEYVLDSSTVNKIAEYGMNVWNIPYNEDKYVTAREAVRKTFDFFKSLDIPMNLKAAGIGEEKLREMAEAAVRHKGGSIRGFRTLNADDVFNIYKASL